MQYKSLQVVIPTRNRAELAKKAIISVLSQENCDFEILVSDNSTDEEEILDLSDFCENLADPRVRYVRPPHPMPMTEHWDWAMRRALESSSFSHVTYLTDRMLFTKNSLSVLQKICTAYPDKIVSYNFDTIDDTNEPVSLLQSRWTGRLFEIDSSSILKIYSDMKNAAASPRMLNCVVPREIIKANFAAYGNYFASVSPDYNFTFRCLEKVNSILYFDKPLLLSYGIYRSNGANMLKGNFQKDSLDFIKSMNFTEVCFDSPVKFVGIIPNVVVHEYCFIKQATENVKFPEINRKVYLQILVDQVFAYGNEEIKREMTKNLQAALGWKILKYRIQAKIGMKSHGVKVKLHNYLNSSDPYLIIRDFQSVEEAIQYAENERRPASANFKLIEDRTGFHPSAEGPVKILRDYSQQTV